MAQWDDDGRKDLLLGTYEGKLLLMLNEGTDENPVFNDAEFLTVGPPGDKTDIYLVSRPAPWIVDWNNDGRRDLVCGAGDGRIYIFINEGTDFAPDYREYVLAQGPGGPITVLYGASSPVVADFDGDGCKDILSGHTAGHLLFYRNIGSDEQPEFQWGYKVESGSRIFNLGGIARTRPCLCDWTGDGILDVLIGSGFAKVHLLEGLEIPDALPDFASFLHLDAPWPQPARASARISFGLDRDAEASLAVYDTAGRLQRHLHEGFFAAGSREIAWDGRDARGRLLPAGVYLIRLESSGQALSRKFLFLR